MATTARVTVTLPTDLVERIDGLERNRSRFIAEAVKRELTRRRRAQLLRSIQRPHPEAVELADTGLAAWATGLPEAQGLVDADGGKPVRWVDGRGFVEETA